VADGIVRRKNHGGETLFPTPAIEEKKAYADFIVDNSGPLDETKRQVEAVWQKLKDFQKEKFTG
jgi:dephospho-CoA kinase